jgi:BirA family biotin operon repressor/biotin-[acetyl-CoA-carboxylase] ligase
MTLRRGSEMLLQKDFQTAAKSLADTARTVVENVVVFQHIDSTQACALRLVEQAEAEEIVLPTTLVIAGEQIAGRGRAARSWTSPPGGLYFSWVASSLESDAIARLPMIVAASITEALLDLGIDDVRIKWPNDVLIGGKKCAGCLVHARHGETTWAVVGIGINFANTPDVPEGHVLPPTSVADEIGEELKAETAHRVLRIILNELTAGVAEPEELLRRWHELIVHRPDDAMIVRIGDGSELQGRFVGLNDEGHLRLDCDGVERVITTGDVVE